MPELNARDPGKTETAAGEVLGHVHSVTGAQASIGLLSANGVHRAGATVGKFIKIHTGKALLIGVITDVSLLVSPSIGEQRYCGVAHVDLTGEISDRGGKIGFRRGVTDYPSIGDAASALTRNELRLVFETSAAKTIKIGQLQQDSAITVTVDVDEMLSKHFAVLGTTGVGKSSAVAVILQQILQVRPDVRILLLDVHNEYGRCFGERAYVVNPGNLRLPFWLFNFEEIVDVFFGGRPGLDEEVEILAEVIPQAKVAYTQYRHTTERPAIKRQDPKSSGYTVDTPVPYRLADLLSQIDERMGKLENRASRMVHHKLMTRIETVSNDPRYAFMFENANVGGDTMAEFDQPAVPAAGRRQADDHHAARRIAGGGRRRRRLRALPHGLRFRHVERYRKPDADRLRGGPSLRLGRPHRRLRPDPPGDLPARQRRPQVRGIPWPRHAASGGARSDHPVPVQHAVRHAHVERPRPGLAALGGLRLGRQPVRLRPRARHPRGACLRRRHAVADPADLRRIAAPIAAAKRSVHRRSGQPNGRPGSQFHRRGGRALARRDHAAKGGRG